MIYYVLYAFSDAYYARGPFNSKREARIWIDGFKAFENDAAHVIGLVNEIMNDNINVERPDIPSDE